VCAVAGLANKLIFHIFFGKTLSEKLYIKVIMWSSLSVYVHMYVVCMGCPPSFLIAPLSSVGQGKKRAC